MCQHDERWYRGGERGLFGQHEVLQTARRVEIGTVVDVGMGTAFLLRGPRVRCIVPSYRAVNRVGMAPGAATRLKSMIFKVPLGATMTFCGLRSPVHETCGVHGEQSGGDLHARGAGRVH